MESNPQVKLAFFLDEANEGIAQRTIATWQAREPKVHQLTQPKFKMPNPTIRGTKQQASHHDAVPLSMLRKPMGKRL